MQAVVFYHANCNDGLVAALVAYDFLGGSADYIPVSYKKEYSEADVEKILSLVKDTHVYILDFSFPKEITVRILQSALEVVWLDHHQSAIETWCGKDYEEDTYSYDGDPDEFELPEGKLFPFILLSKEMSGCLLSWIYFYNDSPVPDLVKYVDDRDRWQFKLENTEALYLGLKSWISRTPNPFSQEGANLLEDCSKLIQEGAPLLDQQKRYVEGQAKRPIEVTINGRTGLASNSSQYFSEVGNALAEKSGTFGMVFRINSPTEVAVSFRSIGKFNVIPLANKYGGGGHPNAAGCSMSLKDLTEILEGKECGSGSTD